MRAEQASQLLEEMAAIKKQPAEAERLLLQIRLTFWLRVFGVESLLEPAVRDTLQISTTQAERLTRFAKRSARDYSFANQFLRPVELSRRISSQIEINNISVESTRSISRAMDLYLQHYILPLRDRDLMDSDFSVQLPNLGDTLELATRPIVIDYLVLPQETVDAAIAEATKLRKFHDEREASLLLDNKMNIKELGKLDIELTRRRTDSENEVLTPELKARLETLRAVLAMPFDGGKNFLSDPARIGLELPVGFTRERWTQLISSELLQLNRDIDMSFQINNGKFLTELLNPKQCYILRSLIRDEIFAETKKSQ